ncbi:MAG: SDR family oxidoreductase [Pseudomonadota bacterium]
MGTTSSNQNVQSQRVLVTGGGSGIGAAIAEKFLSEGARVHVCDIAPEALDAFQKSNPSATTSVTDIGDAASIDRLFADVDEKLGGLDVLINNAGTAGPVAAAQEITIEDWRACFAVNVDAAFLCAARAFKRMASAGGGSIVNLSSSVVLRSCLDRAPYITAKWAIIGLTKSLAHEFASAKIRVNAIAPGAVAGPRMERVMHAEAAASGKSYDEVRKEAEAEAALNGFCEASDIADAAYWLSTSSASRITGQLLPVDGYTI